MKLLSAGSDLALREAMRGQIVMRQGSLIGRATTVCHRQKDATDYSLPIAIPINPPCSYLGLPDPTPDSFWITPGTLTTYETCLTESDGSAIITEFPSLPAVMRLDQSPASACAYQYIIDPGPRIRKYAGGACGGSPTSDAHEPLTFTLQFDSAHMGLYLISYGFVFLAAIPGSAPFDFSTPRSFTNDTPDDHTNGASLDTLTVYPFSP
jgi:hypothetical protein